MVPQQRILFAPRFGKAKRRMIACCSRFPEAFSKAGLVAILTLC
jgi:hypothetical protein